MKKSKKNIGSNLSKIDAHVIQPHEYEEIPELTEEWFQQADLYHGEKLIRRGRPAAEKHGVRTSIRLWPEVDAYFRSLGKGWQTQVNRALKEWAENHPT